jgi:3-hydroxybutyryl-CoA dehydrogenase
MHTICVIGSGTMGNGIAHLFAQNGFTVNLVDISESALERALQTISGNLDRQIKKEVITEADKLATLSRLHTYTSVSMGAAEADLVVEAATENIDLKLSIFRDLDATAPDRAILASNTSSISITRIASVTKRPDKVIGMHYDTFEDIKIDKEEAVFKFSRNGKKLILMDIGSNLQS